MSFDPDSGTQAILEGNARGMHWLVECDFSTGTVYYTTSSIDCVSPNGHTYTGLGSYLHVEDVQETSKPDTGTINLRLGIVNKAMLAFLSGDQSVYRGRDIRMRAQFFNGNFKPIGQPILRWSGAMDTAKVIRDKPNASNGQTYGYIEIPCLRHGFERARNRKGMRMTHERQQLLHPGDLFFQHMKGLVETPSPWLTIAFQKQ
jgi:hypothetical protein